VEFIGREKDRAYLQYIYCKVKQWIQRELSHTVGVQTREGPKPTSEFVLRVP
jgi:hypothetical protein